MTIATRMGGGTPGRVGWVGSLDHTPLAEVFRRIVLEERSGDLQVTTPGAIKTVYFDRGFVVFASSDLKSDRLGESLIEAGRISRQQFAIASKLMQGGKRKFGQALVHAGIMSEEELGRHVAAQVNRIVVSLYSEKQGMYSFDERPCVIPLELMVSLSVYRILIEGIRRMSSLRLILAGLPPLGTTMNIVEAPPFTLDYDKLRPVEQAVIRAVRKGASLDGITKTIDRERGVVLRACYALYAAGVVEAVTAEARSRPRRVQEETGTFVLSEIRRKIERIEKTEKRKKPAGPPGDPDRPKEPTRPPAAEPVLARDRAPARDGKSAEQAELVRPARIGGISRLTDAVSRVRSSLSGAWNRFAAWSSSVSELGWRVVRSFKLTVWNPIPRWVLRLRGRAAGVEPPPAQAVPAPPSSHEDERPASEPLWDRPATPPAPEGVGGIRAPRQEEGLGTRRRFPSWSVDEEHTAKDRARLTESIGPPSWSMKDGAQDLMEARRDTPEQASGPRPTVERLGVPRWSMMDDPSDRTETRREVDEETDSKPLGVKSVGVPSWSIMSEASYSEEEGPAPSSEAEPGLLEHEPMLELELEADEMSGPVPPAPVVETPTAALPDLDSELFLESESEGHEGSSMLSPIPVEEIQFEEEPSEFEIDLETEEGSFADLPDYREEYGPQPEGEPERRPAEPEGQRQRRGDEDVQPTTVSAATGGDQEALSESKPPVAPDGDGEAEAGIRSIEERSAEAHHIRVGGGEKRLLRDVKLHFQFQDWDGAVSLLEQLVQISPGSAFYRGMLARAMSRHPQMRNRAEKHFVEALRLAPQDPQIHYWLGLYYKSFGLRSRAHNEFRTTLRIDPKHEGARKQLAVGEKRGDALGTVFKKFFG